MKKIKNLVFLLLLTINFSCSKNEINEENTFRGFTIENYQDDESYHCEESFNNNVNDSNTNVRICMSYGTGTIKAGKDYLFQFAYEKSPNEVDATLLDVKWEGTEGIKVLYSEVSMRSSYNISFAVIRFDEDFEEGWVKAYPVREDNGIQLGSSLSMNVKIDE